MRKKTRTDVPETELPPSAEEVIAEIAGGEDTPMRSRLAELSNLDRAEMELLKRSWSSAPVERRRSIVSGLSELAEDNVELNFGAVFRFCLQDADDEVRIQAIDGLWEDEDPALIELFIDLLENDPSEQVRATAAAAMGKFAMLAEHGKLRESQTARIEESLLAALNGSDSSEVRRRVLESASYFSLPEIKKAIEDAYRSRDAGLKTSAIYAMGKSCDPAWMPVLMRELSNAEAEIRYEAAGACGELEEEAAVPLLIRLADDFDADVQTAALQALGKIASTQAREFLQECLENENELVRETAEQELKKIAAADDPLSFRL